MIIAEEENRVHFMFRNKRFWNFEINISPKKQTYIIRHLYDTSWDCDDKKNTGKFFRE